MGEYEPDDSRIVTQVAAEAPGEPPRTGPREDQARARSSTNGAQRDESEELEEKGKSTARDAAGEKQLGFKSDSEDEDEDEDEGEAAERERLRKQAGSSLP